MEDKKMMRLGDENPKLSGPVAFIIKRGRRGRGFLVSTFDNPSELIPCSDKSDLSDTIAEILDDISQSRVEFEDSDGEGRRDDASDRDDPPNEAENSGDHADEGIFAGVRNADDPADRLIFNVFSAAIKKGQDISGGGTSRSRRRTSRRRRT